MTDAKNVKAPKARNGQELVDARKDGMSADVTKFLAGLPAQQRPAFEQAFDQFNARTTPPEIELKQEGEAGSYQSQMKGTDLDTKAANYAVHMNAFGTKSQPFIDTVMTSMFKYWLSIDAPLERNYNAALAVLHDVQPQNETEAMLALQMVAANDASIRCLSQMGSASFIDQMNTFGNLANKFMRTFAVQAEAMAKLRRGGEQVVKHVHVNEGGQAVIAGTVNSGGARG